MKSKIIVAFILFFLTEYILRTFVKQYKYHETGILLELLPLAVSTFLIIFSCRRIINQNKIFSLYLKLSLPSIFGLVTAKVVLFFQWYWIIAPEYRNIGNDMQLGLIWTLLETIIGVLMILILYFVLIFIGKITFKKP